MDDLISRAAAIDAVRAFYDEYIVYDNGKSIEDLISELPSAQPERCIDCVNFGKTQLLIQQPDLSEHSTWFRIGETLVEESKMHITAEQAINKIRGYMTRMKKPEYQWIPCDKGEPDEDMECWVTVKTTDTLYRGNFTKRYGERREKGFITSGGFMWWNTAIAWMPIYEPKPYKEKERL